MSPLHSRPVRSLLLVLSTCLLTLVGVSAAGAAPAPGAATIAAGGQHSCAVVVDGRVKCWGDDNGFLGTGATDATLSPPGTVQAIGGGSALTTAASISSAAEHTCAALTDGGVACWGQGTDGKLGNGSTEPAFAPIAVGGLNGVIAVAAGGRHSCALRSNGGVACWGNGSEGQIGDNSVHNNATLAPAAVAGIDDATSISAGADHTCVVRKAGSVACWGSNEFGQLGAGQTGSGKRTATAITVPGLEGVLSVATGDRHTCALRTDGSVRCWGEGSDGQLGNGGATSSVSPVTVNGLNDAVAISAGRAHSCAVRTGGQVVCWGNGTSGQLGNGTSGAGTKATSPVAATGVSGIAAVAAGANHTCVMTQGGDARCWGAALQGQTGDGGSATISLNPLNVPGVNASTLTGAGLTNCVIDGGAVKCWGQFPESSGSGNNLWSSGTPDAIGVSDADGVAVGSAHACAVRTNGTVACWGDNSAYQLGNTGSATMTPTTVGGLSGVTAIASRNLHTCVVTGGEVRCWGLAIGGQIGNGSTGVAFVPSPTKASGITDATAVATGFSHSCAILGDQSVDCWGDNQSGQLGTPAGDTPANTPQQVPGVSGAVAISAGTSHTCVLKSDQTVSCWGDTGDGTPLEPTAIGGLTNVTAIGTGDTHTCAVKADRTVWCFGNGSSGQLGGSTDSATVARQITGINDAIDVAGGALTTCVRRTGGAVSCLGDGSSGGLGVADFASFRLTAVDVLSLTGLQLPVAPLLPVLPDPTPNPTPTPAPVQVPVGPAPQIFPILPPVTPPVIPPTTEQAPEPAITAKRKLSRKQALKQLRFRVRGGKPGSTYRGVLKVGKRGGKTKGKLDEDGEALIKLKLPKKYRKKVKKGTKLTLSINVYMTDGKLTKVTRIIKVK